MRKRSGPSKGRKRGQLKRNIILLGTIIFFLVLFINISTFGHFKEFRAALDRYDVITLKKELSWINEEAQWLKKIPIIRDGEFWFRLNQGEYAGLEAELSRYTDDKHRFWLFQLLLLTEQESKAELEVQQLKTPALHTLAEGLLSAKLGDFQKAHDQVRAATDSELSQEQKVLKNITIARIEMSLGQLNEAIEAWKRAKDLSPRAPVIVETEYDLALARGEWGKAKEVGRQLEEIPGYSKQPEFIIKKALLALTIGERQVWEQIISDINTIDQGKAYQDYLLGIECYELGQFDQAAEYFRNSLDGKLPKLIARDAEKAMVQAKERIQAEPALNSARKQ